MGWNEAIKDALQAGKGFPEMIQKLATVQMEGAKLAQENAELREELLTLKEAAKLRDVMVFHDNVYWMTRDGKEEGPFCPKCWDGDGKAVRMIDYPSLEDWLCHVSKTTIRKPGIC